LRRWGFGIGIFWCDGLTVSVSLFSFHISGRRIAVGHARAIDLGGGVVAAAAKAAPANTQTIMYRLCSTNWAHTLVSCAVRRLEVQTDVAGTVYGHANGGGDERHSLFSSGVTDVSILFAGLEGGAFRSCRSVACCRAVSFCSPFVFFLRRVGGRCALLRVSLLFSPFSFVGLLSLSPLSLSLS
jgi:hypothetical protein